MRAAVAICAACVMVVAVASMLTCSYFVIRASFNRRRPSQRWFVTRTLSMRCSLKMNLRLKG